MFSQAPFCSTSFSSIATAIHSAEAAITATATLTCDMFSGITASAAITASAIVSAIGGFTSVGEANITTSALVIGIAFATYSRNATVTSAATVSAKGYRLGEEWTTSTAGSNTWTQIG
jgi:hypothetical protein